MSKIRETLITNCEKKFLSKCLTEWTRLDGRSFDEFRRLDIRFGKDWGSCMVSLGKTRVLAQTSCEIQQPKSSRPSEGILYINLELNPIAAPQFEPGRQSELGIQLNRLLEKCIKDSKAIDLEALCIKTSEKVWALRVDVNVINHEGNILDCASIAMLASLTHFRRPDVTCDGEEFIIHTYEQRDPIPTVIHHYPVCITYAIFNNGEYVLADPLLLEEGTAEALLSVGVNGFRELCGLHLGGSAELLPNIVLSTVSKASTRAAKVIDEIKSAIKLDNEKRENKSVIGFHISLCVEKSADLFGESMNMWNQKKRKERKVKAKEPVVEAAIVNPQVEILGEGSVAHVQQNTDWKAEESEDDLIIVEKARVEIDLLDSNSEEEEVMILGSKESVKKEHI